MGSNFATRPGLVTFPLPSIEGEAALPSTFDLFVNGALRLRHDVPAGPFSIDDVPVVTGEGDIRVVVRDLLGREQVISQSYYASPRLLRRGLHEYSYEIGVTRRNFGLASNDYGRALAVGTHRIGLTSELTGELHGELLRDRQTFGLGGAMLVRPIGVLSASVAGSHSDEGSGGMLAFALERRARRLGFGGSIQLATEAFAHVGIAGTETVPRRTGRLFVSGSLGALGSLGLTYTAQRFHDRAPVDLVSARHSIGIGRFGFLGLSLLRILGERGDTIVDLTFTRALDDRTSSSLNAVSESDHARGILQIQRNAPAGRGLGYRVRAGVGGTDRHEAALSWQNDIGTYRLDGGTSQGATRIQASASGSIAVLGDRVFPSRRIDGSFAVARVADHSDVRVYSDNQLVARTDDDGYALLPGLRPYQTNLIRIEQADLPLDVEIDATQLTAVPYFRSGLLLDFPVRTPRGALISIVLENGAPLPAGALVQVRGQARQFPSGLNGEVYVTGLAAKSHLQVTWNDQSCEIAFDYAPGGDPLPRLGPFRCAGIPPAGATPP